MSVVLAIDPGREKCGVAVVGPDGVLHREIASTADAITVAQTLIGVHSPDRVIVGNGTGGAAMAESLRASARVPVELVDESHSTLRARARYFEEHPPRGLLRLIPRGLLTPDRPYDDLVAVILAEEYLAREEATS